MRVHLRWHLKTTSDYRLLTDLTRKRKSERVINYFSKHISPTRKLKIIVQETKDNLEGIINENHWLLFKGNLRRAKSEKLIERSMSPRAQSLAQARQRRHIAFSRKLWSHTSSPSASYTAIYRQKGKGKLGTVKDKATTGKSSMKPLDPMRKKPYERVNSMAPKAELRQATIDRFNPEEKISESHLKHFEGCLRKDKPE